MNLFVKRGTKSNTGSKFTRHIPVRLALNRQAERELEAYLEHTGYSLNALVRKLVLNELVEQTVLYERSE